MKMKLTQKQKAMVQDAIGNGLDFPKMTNDPLVNHAVDMVICGEVPWEELSQEDQLLYYAEAAETNM